MRRSVDAAGAGPRRVAAAPLRGKNLLLLLALAALWGTAFMFISMGLPRFPPVLFAAIRFDIAGLVLLAIALWRRADLRPRTRAQWTAIALAAVLNVAGYHAFLFWGQQYTTAGVAAVIVALNPLLTTVASRALLEDERIGWRGLLGLALGFGGAVALAVLKPGPLFTGAGLAELAILGAVACWAVGATGVRKTQHGLDVFAFTAWQQLVGAVLLHGASLALEPQAVVWDGPGVVALLYLALVSSSLGFVMFFTLLERVGPIRATTVSHVAPVFAALAGTLVLGQAFEPRAVLAFALIAGGFFLVVRSKGQAAPPDPPASR